MTQPTAAAVFADAHAALFAALGVDATVQRGAAAPAAVRVIVRDGVARIGEYGQVLGRARHVSFNRAQWQPARGDVVVIGGDTRTVEAIESDDGYAVEAVLHG
ncbi:MAG TPA: hypothetical protein VF216_12215 [Mizugakiibacter sp.]